MTRFSIDANVLVYAMDPAETAKYARALDLMARAPNADCILTAQALGEFLWAATRKHGVLWRDARDQIDDWQSIFPIVATTFTQVRAGSVVAEAARLAFWDGQMIATVAAAGAAVLLSEDMQDGATIAGVAIRNPFIGPVLPSDIEALLT